VKDVRRSGWRAAGPALVAAAALLALRARGPTAGWRHGEIGAGRVSREWLRTPNAVHDFLHKRRRFILWEADGRESSVGIESGGGIGFLLNGKSDGNARGDAATTVMLGLIDSHTHPTGACLTEFDHPIPEMETVRDVLDYVRSRAEARLALARVSTRSLLPTAISLYWTSS
jgi:hypothetical protein